MGKQKKDGGPPNPKNVHNRDLYGRINFLYQASTLLATRGGASSLTRHYVACAKGVAQKSQLRMSVLSFLFLHLLNISGLHQSRELYARDVMRFCFAELPVERMSRTPAKPRKKNVILS